MTAPSSDSAAIRQTIRALKAAGYTLDSVWDGVEESTPVKNETEALEVIMGLDQAHLYVVQYGSHTGWVFFVLGNEPDEVINDYTLSLEAVIDPLIRSWW